jgi:hypothetical protein
MATDPSLSTNTMPTTANGTMPATGNGTMDAHVTGLATPPSVMAHPYAMVSIKSHVPFMLEQNSNYSKWAFFFKSHLANSGFACTLMAPLLLNQ